MEFTVLAAAEDECPVDCCGRDLKPENFLLSDKSEDAPLKATDFGLSVFYKPGQVFNDIVGSAYYVAPEVRPAPAAVSVSRLLHALSMPLDQLFLVFSAWSCSMLLARVSGLCSDALPSLCAVC